LLEAARLALFGTMKPEPAAAVSTRPRRLWFFQD
jgi:hypothetical protein